MEVVFVMQKDHCLPEHKLWAAVIHRALLDACGFVGKSDDSTSSRQERISDEAIRWFRNNNEDFQAVCDFIGLDSDAGRRVALRRISESHGLESVWPYGQDADLV